MNKLLTLIAKHEEKIKILLIFYALYCAVIIGVSWDEKYYHALGRINLNYLLSFGLLEENFHQKYRYSTLYWSFSSLISQLAPIKYIIEIHHIINTIFGLLIILGIYQVTKNLFNKSIAKISSVFLFLIPFFFGHLAINSKDTIVTFAHVWTLYYLIKYSIKRFNLKKRLIIILKISSLSALGTGIQLLFLGSLVPIVILFFLYIIFLKKRNLKEIFVDFLIYLILFYFILVLFWVDTHSNIFTLPLHFFVKTLSLDIGWPFNLLNGDYSSSKNVNKGYLLINYFYKLPEFIIFLYIVSFPIIILNFQKLKKKFNNVLLKLLSILLLLIFPNFVLIFISYPIYDGLRLFLWVTPYLVLIPAVTFYLLTNYRNIFFTLVKSITIILIIFHTINFLSITPYHYTYLNAFSGEKDKRYKKFENDYWSVTLKELILSSNLPEKKINFHSCGVSPGLTKTYMKQRYGNVEYTDIKNATYIIMTNRTVSSRKGDKITNCFDEYTSENVHQVVRNGIILSAIKKIK